MAGTVMSAREAVAEPSGRLDQTDPLSAESLAALLRREVAGCSGPRSVLVVHELEPGTAQHRIVAALHWRGGLDSTALGRALNDLVARRVAALPSLGGGSGQHGAGAAEARLREHDADRRQGAQVAEWLEPAAHEPLDLVAGQIAQIQVYRRTASEVIVLVVVHHQIADFWSMTTLIRELETLYCELKGSIPASLPGLADFVRHYVWVAGTRASTYATGQDTSPVISTTAVRHGSRADAVALAGLRAAPRFRPAADARPGGAVGVNGLGGGDLRDQRLQDRPGRLGRSLHR